MFIPQMQLQHLFPELNHLIRKTELVGSRGNLQAQHTIRLVTEIEQAILPGQECIETSNNGTHGLATAEQNDPQHDAHRPHPLGERDRLAE